MDTTTGERLAVLRNEHGLSQEELAARLGVSRQAVSNWERCESMPDTGNLIGLSRLYGIAIDEVIHPAPRATVIEATPPSTNEGAVVPRARLLVSLVTCAVLTAVYYGLIALPLTRSTVSDAAEVFGLTIGPALAMTWFASEVIFVLLPFLLIAIVPTLLPRWVWAVPLAVFVVPSALVAGYSALGGAAVLDYPGLGGALMPSLALKADALALVLGCALVHIARGNRAHLAVASTPTSRGSEVV
jgi:transcriptional regulator with XRE-family HTH domain